MVYKKRTYKKKAKKKEFNNFLLTNGSGIGRPFPLPQTYRFHARYVATRLTVDPGIGGVPASQIFSLNGLYDSDITGVGHQCLGFDQLMPMYERYTVIGAKVRLDLCNYDTESAQHVILQVKDNPTLGVNLNQIIENGNCRHKVVGPKNSGSSVCTMSLSVSMNNFFGKNIRSEDDYRGDVNNNPIEQAYLHIITAPLDAVNALPLRISVVIDYIAILTEPKNLSQS